MAKRRKEKDEEEDKPFKLPKFDEEKFIKKEKKKIKTTFLSFILGLLIAFVSFGLWALMSGNELRWPLILLFGVITGSWLKYFFIKLKVDLSDFGRKDWFGAYMIYFFTWLVVLILISNPPIYDDEDPKIDLAVLPDVQEFGGNVLIVAKITDNTQLSKDDITFTLNDVEVPKDNFEYIENEVFKYVHIPPSNLTEDITYNFKLIAKDKSGRSAEKTGNFGYSKKAIELASKSNISVNNGDSINFIINAKNIQRVYYTVNSNKTKIDMIFNKNSGFYETYPKYWEGIKRDQNVTLQVYAVSYKFFEEPTNDQDESSWRLKDLKWYHSFNNTVVDTSQYHFKADADMIGDAPPAFTQKNPRDVFEKVPGFEILAFLISLGAVVLIFKYSKKHRRN